MPSSFNHWLELALPNALHLIGIFVIALVLNRLLRAVTNLVIKQASAPGRSAQLREQQTRTLAGVLYGAGSKVVWVVALLTAVREFHIDITPALTLAGLASLAVASARRLWCEMSSQAFISFSKINTSLATQFNSRTTLAGWNT